MGNIARSLGMGDNSAQILATQMAEYLRDNSRSIEGAKISNLTSEDEEDVIFRC